jgi:DNA repair exonuclease SbcCD nuclease subunit
MLECLLLYPYSGEEERRRVMSRALRIVHAADFHLGSPFSSLSSAKAQLRRAEQQQTFARVISLCLETNADFLLLAGDVMDQVRFSGESLREMIQQFSRIPETRVVIAPGNHDPYTEDSPYVTEAFPPNVYIFGKAFSSFSFPEISAVVWGVGFTGVRAPRFLAPPTFTSRRAEFPEDTIHLLVMHGEVIESPGQKSAYNPIPRDFLVTSGADYIALGHVHEPSGVRKAGGSFFAYPGCPEARGYDEPGERGVYAGTVAKGQVDLRYIPVNTRLYVRPSIDVTGAMTEIQLEELCLSRIAETYGDSYREHAYRITLTGALPPDFTPSLASLRNRLGELVFDVRLYDETSTALDPELLRSENSLRGRFTDRILRAIEEAGAAGDESRRRDLELAFTLGLRAFEGEVPFDEDS